MRPLVAQLSSAPLDNLIDWQAARAAALHPLGRDRADHKDSEATITELRVEAEVSERAFAGISAPVVPARLGDAGGAIGAALLVEGLA